MLARATDGTCLAKLVQMAIPLLRAAQRQCPRTGPGRPPDYDDWKIAVMIVAAILKNRKTKSAQYRFLQGHRRKFRQWLGLRFFPVRSTYFERYRHAYALLQTAIRLQGVLAIRLGLADASVVAVDKSLLRARGPEWNHKDRKAHRIPPRLHGVDRDSAWGYSPHHHWVQGYSFEVVVTAPPRGGTVWPLLASADRANASEKVSFGSKIDLLPRPTRFALADSGYDTNEYGDRVERDDQGRPNGRHFVCPPQQGCPARPPDAYRLTKAARLARQRRIERVAFYRSRRGQRLFARRGTSVEPFNQWFKSAFSLGQTVWHRGLANNQTQLTAAIFAYQLLLRYNHACGRENGQIQWITERL
jgi:hypothetical protein